jgi:hypothetical protein
MVPSDGVMPSPLSIRPSDAGADVPVRLVPVRAELERVREAAFRRPPDRLLVFLRPVERLLVFFRLLVFLRPPVERLLVFFRLLVFLRPPVERLLVFFRLLVFLRPPVERDAVLRAPDDRVLVRRALVARVVRRAVPPLERVLEVFLRALAIRAPPR